MQSEITIREGGERYLRWCKLNNYSLDTVLHYERTLHNFSLFCSLDVPLANLIETLMEDYILYLREKGISSVTLNTYVRGMKTIANYLIEKGLLKPFEIIIPKAETTVKEVYTETELNKLLKKPDVKKCSFSQYRNWVMVNYLLGTGQRRNTVVNIKIGDLDLENQLVRLNVMKNRKQVILPLTKSLVNILEEYLTYRGGTDQDYLFCTWEGKQFTRDGLTLTIRKYNIKRGVDRTSMHLFRHTFAYLAIKNNMDIIRLQQLLCHSKLETTQRYLQSFGFEDLKENYERYNPLEVIIGNNSISRDWRDKQKKLR